MTFWQPPFTGIQTVKSTLVSHGIKIHLPVWKWKALTLAWAIRYKLNRLVIPNIQCLTLLCDQKLSSGLDIPALWRLCGLMVSAFFSWSSGPSSSPGGGGGHCVVLLGKTLTLSTQVLLGLLVNLVLGCNSAMDYHRPHGSYKDLTFMFAKWNEETLILRLPSGSE